MVEKIFSVVIGSSSLLPASRGEAVIKGDSIIVEDMIRTLKEKYPKGEVR